jgi:hypothetical protein
MSKLISYQFKKDNEIQNKRIVLSSLLKKITKNKTIINTNVKKYKNYPNPYVKDFCLIYEGKKLQNPDIVIEINNYLKKENNMHNILFKELKEIDYNYYIFEWIVR